MAASAFVNDAIALTLDNYLPRMQDNFSVGSPFLQFLKMRHRQKADGGPNITVPVRSKENPNKGTFGRNRTLLIADHDFADRATYPWCHYYITITVEDIDVIENMGRGQIADLVDEKILASEKDMAEDINAQLLSPALAVPNDGLGDPQFIGLGHLINDSEATTVGGIRPNGGETWWKAYVPDDRPANYDYAENFRKDLIKHIQVASRNQQFRADGVITTLDNWSRLDETAWDKARLGMPSGTAVEFSFDNFMIRGALVLWDDKVEAPAAHTDRVYILNSETLKFVTHTSAYMRYEKNLRVPEFAGERTQIFCTAQLTIGNRRANAVWDQVA